MWEVVGTACFGAGRFVEEGAVFYVELLGDGREGVDIAVGGYADELEFIAVFANDFERAFANRARGSEKDNFFPVRHFCCACV